MFRIHWFLLRTSLEERLMYRGDFAFGTFVRFLPIVTQICLWGAIFGVGSSSETQRINGYSYPEMVAYYLLTMVARAFSSMPGLARDIAKEIREGSLKRYLTQPVDMQTYYFWSRVAHKLVYYMVATIPFVVLFWLCRQFFTHVPTLGEWVGVVIALVLAFQIGFLMENLIGLAAFWLLEVGSISFICMMLTYFLSGHMLPLDWLPGIMGKVVTYLPFQYLAYFPAAIVLGKLSPEMLWMHLGIATLWTLGLWALCRLVFALGLKRYGAYGG
jgi:ABC-2 type transport system permease protein